MAAHPGLIMLLLLRNVVALWGQEMYNKATKELRWKVQAHAENKDLRHAQGPADPRGSNLTANMNLGTKNHI